jgi:hypothetical protein
MQLEREEGIMAEKPHVTLLRNIADVWTSGDRFHSTEDLITMLIARFPRSWGPSEKYPKGLTAQRFGRMLVKNYGVYSDRNSEGTRGYFARSFDVACRSVRIPTLEPTKPPEPEPSRHFHPGTADGRCDFCGFHVETQGHRDGCQQI